MSALSDPPPDLARAADQLMRACLALPGPPIDAFDAGVAALAGIYAGAARAPHSKPRKKR